MIDTKILENTGGFELDAENTLRLEMLKKWYSENPTLEADLGKLLAPGLTVNERYDLSDELNNKYRTAKPEGMIRRIRFDNDEGYITLNVYSTGLIVFKVDMTDKDLHSSEAKKRQEVKEVLEPKQKQ